MTYVDHARAVTPYYTPDTIFLPFAIREAHLGRLSALVLSREWGTPWGQPLPFFFFIFFKTGIIPKSRFNMKQI